MFTSDIADLWVSVKLSMTFMFQYPVSTVRSNTSICSVVYKRHTSEQWRKLCTNVGGRMSKESKEAEYSSVFRRRIKHSDDYTTRLTWFTPQLNQVLVPILNVVHVLRMICVVVFYSMNYCKWLSVHGYHSRSVIAGSCQGV